MKLRTGLLAGEALISKQRVTYPQGMGDIVADLTHKTGLDKISSLYEDISGKSCGCDVRQQKLNALFPL